jgi:transcriptional regulator PpsR
VTNAPQGPAEAPDLGALSELAPELAQTFVSVASDIALVIDATGVIRSVATGAASIASAASWIGRPWAETVTGETRTKIEQLLSEAQSSGVTRRREVNHPIADGHDIPVAYAAIRLGRDGPVLAVGRDLRAVSAIQQRFVEAQQEMERDYWQQRQSDARYRMLFQVATDAVLVVDAQRLIILEANQAATSLFGLALEALVGQPASVGVTASARPAVDELLATARARGVPGEMRTRGARDYAGRPLLLDLSATPFRADDAHLLLVRARAVDADTHTAQERLADFVERTPDAVVITDSAGRVMNANPAFQALCRMAVGVRADGKLTGRLLADLLGDPRQELPAILHDARHHGIAEKRCLVVGGAMGETFDAELSAALLAEGDQECLGLTLRRVDQRLTALPPQVGELAVAIDRLAAQVGLVSLPELLQETAEIAERHLLEAALQRSQGDRLKTALLLGISMDNLWLRLRHHGMDRAGSQARPPSGLLN